MTNSKSNQEIVQGLHREVKALRAENKALRRLVKELEEKLNTNSRNSSKAPSQDPYRRRKGKKKPSEKGQGAQEGHKGHARSAVPPENLNEFRVFTRWSTLVAEEVNSTMFLDVKLQSFQRSCLMSSNLTFTQINALVVVM